MVDGVREIDHLWITLADGCRLAARLWLPETAESEPVPALLEYVPYRKDDGMAARDAPLGRWFARHGYAYVRVDLRGSGSSDGLYLDEYLPQEQLDALEVIAWLAEQPWCSGAVGMLGISWGGFNSLQVAACRPPALKAIVTMCSTDDRYADDVHYMGGCVLAFEMPTWAASMLAYNALPPLPSVVGDGWREQWLARLDGTPPFVEPWLRHQRRDAYWQQGSVCEDYAAIECAVYAVGGWADGYSNAIPRLLAGLPGPKKGLIGPWGHTWPQAGTPGPAIGFLQECRRWWDHWLKGIDTGIMDEPALRAWVVDALRPHVTYDEMPGRWVAEAGWPPAVEPQQWVLNATGLDQTPAAPAEVAIRGDQATGSEAGVWCPYGEPGEFPPDQRADDGRSLALTSPPLDQPLDILGFPEATLTLAADRPLALVAVRLCDVWPDGASTLITRGLLNLAHRAGHDAPAPLVPGEPVTVTVRLNAIGYHLPAGHRLRVALSPTYWPWAWPSPEPVTLTLRTGDASRLTLPVRPPRPEDAALPPFAESESGEPLAVETLRDGAVTITATTDYVRGQHLWVQRRDYGRHFLLGSGIVTDSSLVDAYEIADDAPLSAAIRCERTERLEQGDWRTRVEVAADLTADQTTFRVTSRLDAYEADVRIFTKSWTWAIPRDHV